MSVLPRFDGNKEDVEENKEKIRQYAEEIAKKMNEHLCPSCFGEGRTFFSLVTGEPTPCPTCKGRGTVCSLVKNDDL
mgnify:CR=1 FL=1